MATTKKAKKLNLSTVTKDAKALEEQLLVVVNSPVNGESYELSIDKKFRKSKTLLMCAELLDTYQFAKLNNIQFDLIFQQFSLLLLIKHFTSFGASMPEKINEQIGLLSKLDDLGLLELIIEAMPEDEVQDAFEMIGKTIDVINTTLETTTISQEELEQRITEMEAQEQESE